MIHCNRINFFHLIIIFFVSITVYSQNFEKIKNADTVYVFFKQEIYKQMYFPQPKGYGDYHFVYNEYYKQTHVIFYHNPNTPKEKIEKKSFLRKNKDVLINYEFLINMLSFEEAKKLLLSKKKIYLVDNNDIGWFSVKLKEVKINDYNLNPIE